MTFRLNLNRGAVNGINVMFIEKKFFSTFYNYRLVMKLIFYKITNMVNIGAFYIIKCLVKLKTYKTSKLSTKKKT